jgi:hypothetical protein
MYVNLTIAHSTTAPLRPRRHLTASATLTQAIQSLYPYPTVFTLVPIPSDIDNDRTTCSVYHHRLILAVITLMRARTPDTTLCSVRPFFRPTLHPLSYGHVQSHSFAPLLFAHFYTDLPCSDLAYTHALFSPLGFLLHSSSTSGLRLRSALLSGRAHLRLDGILHFL